jgi:hypothetical protein
VFACGNGTMFHYLSLEVTMFHCLSLEVTMFRYLSLEVGAENNGYSLGTTVERAYRLVKIARRM